MCGITGIFAFNLVGKFNLVNVTAATQALAKRGPDNQDIYHDEFVGLGHRRLSIIDTSAIAHQPMWDETKRYCIIFNGEIFNFLELKKELDYVSLHTYLQLNYIPAPRTIFQNVKKLLPGHYLKVKSRKLEDENYYSIPHSTTNQQPTTSNYTESKEKFKQLLEASVQRRLIADVPLGSFLSGGIDSSIVTGLATKHKSNLHTFSIGFKDEKFFDETNYARLVAKHFKTDHTVFSLTNNDLYEHVNSILDYIDEPFADSSAINVYILSKETRKHATVALSGDGADELLAGYNKHAAFYRAIHPGWKETLASSLLPLWKNFPQSRNSFFSNKVRQLQ